MNLQPTIRCLTFEARLNRVRADRNYNYDEERDYTPEEIAEQEADREYQDFKDNPDRPKFKRLKQIRSKK